MNTQSYLVYVWFSGQELLGQIPVLKSAPSGTPPKVGFALRDLLKHAMDVVNHHVIQPADHHTTARIIKEMYEMIYAVRKDPTKAPKWAPEASVTAWCKIKEIVSWDEAYYPNDVAEIVKLIQPNQTVDDYRRHMQATIAYYENLFAQADAGSWWKNLHYDFSRSRYVLGDKQDHIFSHFYQVQDYWVKTLKEVADKKNKHAIKEVEKWRLTKAYNDMMLKRQKGEQSNQHVMFDNHMFGPLPTMENLEHYLDVVKYYYLAREVTHEINGKPEVLIGDPYLSVIIRHDGCTDKLFHFTDRPWEEAEPLLLEMLKRTTDEKAPPVVE